MVGKGKQMIEFSFEHTDLSYGEWMSLLLQLMPEMLVNEVEGELVISTGLDAISIFHDAMQDYERED
jgi:hypothetical protein